MLEILVCRGVDVARMLPAEGCVRRWLVIDTELNWETREQTRWRTSGGAFKANDVKLKREDGVL